MTDNAALVEQLLSENRKLKKINAALIKRVESVNTPGADAYSAFGHSVVLAEQVRERTEALNNALARLKESNAALQSANEQAAMYHRRLADAIESISDAFVLFDKDRALVMCNQKFRAFWIGTPVTIQQGITIQDIVQLSYQHNLISEELKGEDGRVRIFKTRQGRWLQMREMTTFEEGVVILLTDITELKESERASRERALEQKSRLLQRTVDNLSQGVVLVNPEGQVELWNDRFIELTGVERTQVEGHPPFASVMSQLPAMLNHALSGSSQGEVQKSEQMLKDGRVLELRTHPMPAGGFVNTYTDITQRYRYAETLRESERWVRLITDHVPALIAYVGHDMTYRFTNKVYDEWYGFEPGELLGKSVISVQGGLQFAALKPFITRALNGESVTFEFKESNAAGEKRYMLKHYVPNLDASGESVGFFVMNRDITERHRTAEELRQSYQLLEQRVEERTSELTALNGQLLQEIHERREIEAMLRVAKKEAEQANLSKTKFLAAVSHDLLQPLNAARLFMGALSELPQAEQTQKLVQSASNSLEDVESLLGTLVDISKLDAGVVTPDLRAFEVGTLIENIANEFSQHAQKAGLGFRWVPCSASINSDSQLLARILRNFLTNAIRYTREGQILFGARRRGQQLEIQVWDTGVGIPDSKLDEVFIEFKRIAKQEEDAPEKGLGLGLAIVDKISRVLGHPIHVASDYGRGSMFSVTVPLASVNPQKAAMGPMLPQVIDHVQGAEIWLIDNDPSICSAMSALLSGWGCDVLTALSLDDLVSKVSPQEQLPDLLIVDYHLDNDENGVDAARELDGLFPDKVPVLMITANYSQDLKQDIRELGYLLMHKPVRPMRLKAALSHLIGGSLATPP
ncbi:MAG: NahK/ErcS family hybrid sensor histidine kinase/response regulator [Pontibacterium sp.]